MSFLLFLITIILNSWYGGAKGGLITTILTSLSFVYFFLSPPQMLNNPLKLIQLGVFMFAGSLISLIVEKYKRTDIVQTYQSREKVYTQILGYLYKANLSAIREIKARDEFLSIASHELKTPLTSMLLQLQTILYNIRHVSLANFSVESLLKMLESAENTSKRMSKMIGDLLNVSLITTGRLDLEREEANLVAIVKDVLERFSEKLDKYPLKLEFKKENEFVGNWDKLRIEQAITNLISNAIKYGEGKPIKIQVLKDGNFAKLVVKDSGIGIPAERQKKIFERFERAVSTSKYEGLGVGLYITYQIIKTHGGSINVKSKQNEGTTFEVKLPLSPPVQLVPTQNKPCM